MTVISSPGELVALVPSVIGFDPVESVVVVLVCDRSGLASVARLDVADLLGDAGAGLELDLARLAVREGAHRAVLIAYTDDQGAGCRAVARAAGALDDAVGAVECLVVTDGRYFNPDCRDPLCCPPGGRAVPADFPRGPSATAPAGRARSDLRRLCGRAADRWTRRAASDLDQWRRRSLEKWREALAAGVEGPAPLGRLAAALADVRVRDAVLLTLVPGAGAAVEDALAGRDSAAVAAALGHGMRPASPPDPLLARDVRELLDAVLTHVPARLAAPPAAVLGVMAWWDGEPEAARAWCAIALGHDPEYRLAALTLALIDAAEAAR